MSVESYHTDAFKELTTSLELDYQKRLHVSDEVFSVFSKTNMPVSPYYCFDEKLNSTQNEDSITYNVKSNAHMLMGCEIHQRLPKVVFKEGYKGLWVPFVGIHAFKEVSFYINEQKISLDQLSSQILLDVLLDEPTKSTYVDALCSSVKRSQQVLEEETVVFIPEFPFKQRDPSTAFPLFLTSFKDNIGFEVKPQADVTNILLVIDVNTSKISVCNLDVHVESMSLDDVTINKMPPPEVKAILAYVDKSEVDFMYTEVNEKGLKLTAMYFMSPNIYIKDLQANNEKFNVEINNLTTEHPCTLVSYTILDNLNGEPLYVFMSNMKDYIVKTNKLTTGKSTLIKDKKAYETKTLPLLRSNGTRSLVNNIHYHHTSMIRFHDGTIKPGFVFKDGCLNIECHPIPIDMKAIIILFTNVCYQFKNVCSNEKSREGEQKTTLERICIS